MTRDVPLADRLNHLPPYMFGEINRLKDARRRDGIDVIDMAMGNPTDPTPAPIVDKLCEVVRDPRNHRYSAAAGLYNLRREVAAYYRDQWEVALDPDHEVIATIGSKEGFSHLCLALLGPGDLAMVPAPSYPIHRHAVALAGGDTLDIPVTDDAATLARIDALCRGPSAPSVLFLNYPHNPTGHVVEAGFFAEIVTLARRHGFVVVHDFAYGQITFDGFRAPSFMTVPGAKDVGVEFTTMSKTFNMAGWRIGYCVGNPRIIRGLATIKGYYDYGIFQAIQIAAIVALRLEPEAARRQAQRYEERRDVLLDGLRRLGWPEVASPRGGMFVWAAVPEAFAEWGSLHFARRLLDDAAVAVAPGAGFGAEGEGNVRMALIENRQRIRQAVRQIKRATTQWLGSEST